MVVLTAVIHKEEDMYIAECPEVGTVVPMHKELKIGTLKGILKLAKVDIDELSKYL